MIDRTTRRGFLAGALVAPGVASGLAAAPTRFDATGSVAEDLKRYVDFGNKQSGGQGDNRCGAWLESALRASGYAVERQTISVPYFAPERCELRCGEAVAPLRAHPIVRPTGSEGLSAPLVRVLGDGTPLGDLSGAIALFDLPYGRWSSILSPVIRKPIEASFAAGARAVVIVTSGPTGKIIALNTDGREPMFAGPVALLAPADAGPFLKAASAGTPVTLNLRGEVGRRPAFNLLGRMDRGKGRWLVVSTPRSGWTTCAGERGGGVAAWLAIARWAARAAPDHDLAFVCNSGHEYEYLGAEEMLREIAPRPGATDFWLHLGANVAARDWHEAVGLLRPLPGTDSQRYLVVSPALLPEARRAFAGLPGLEAPYASDELSAGELTNIIAAGYPKVAGVFGIHRFHHVEGDEMRCVDAGEVAKAAEAFRQLTERAIAS